MKCRIVAAGCAAAFYFMAVAPAIGAPTSFRITIPLRLGERHDNGGPLPGSGDGRTERRLRLVRYAMQLADGIVSIMGYRAYAKCLSCLAFPGGGPRGSAAFSVMDLRAGQSAESNPLIAPFSHGDIASLALGTVLYDVADAQIERRWSPARRSAADIAEIGAHAWGISTWLPELRTIKRDKTIAAACGAQWQARQFGQAFSDGCVNAFYRPGPTAPNVAGTTTVTIVCAPARFAGGTYLFATASSYFVASGSPCPSASSP